MFDEKPVLWLQSWGESSGIGWEQNLTYHYVYFLIQTMLRMLSSKLACKNVWEVVARRKPCYSVQPVQLPRCGLHTDVTVHCSNWTARVITISGGVGNQWFSDVNLPEQTTYLCHFHIANVITHIQMNLTLFTRRSVTSRNLQSILANKHLHSIRKMHIQSIPMCKQGGKPAIVSAGESVVELKD